MKVVEIVRHGDPDVLQLGKRPDPKPGPGEVEVRVLYSGVNRADLLQRRGQYPAPRGFSSDIPGLEYAGVIESLGKDCGLRAVGERVMGVLGGGGYAERVVVSERETIGVPEGMAMEAAGAVPEVFMTAWDALFRQAGLRSGEVVLIHAVGSGVGTAGLQLARTVGALTIGTSRTREKLRRAKEMGLDEGVLAACEGDWAQQVAGRLDGQRVDVVLDLVGATYLEGNLQLLASGARWMIVGVPSGSIGLVDLRQLMVRRASLIGTVLRARPPEEKAILAREFERTVIPLFASGHLAPVLDRVFPASDAAEAHRYVEGNNTFGTIVLSWEGMESR